MVFATGNIYKGTGTASEEIEDTTSSFRIKREEATYDSRGGKSMSMGQSREVQRIRKIK